MIRFRSRSVLWGWSQGQNVWPRALISIIVESLHPKWCMIPLIFITCITVKVRPTQVACTKTVKTGNRNLQICTLLSETWNCKVLVLGIKKQAISHVYYSCVCIRVNLGNNNNKINQSNLATGRIAATPGGRPTHSHHTQSFNYIWQVATMCTRM